MAACCMSCDDIESQQLPLQVMKCGQHRYCAECFCERLESAINNELYNPIPCFNKQCSRPNYKDVWDILFRFPEIGPLRRTDLLFRYATRTPEYKTPLNDRVYCSNRSCVVVQGHSKFLDVNAHGREHGLRVKCPDCDTFTCTECKGFVGLSADLGHVCTSNAHGVPGQVAKLSDDKKWMYRKCENCDVWTGKNDPGECNHMSCDRCDFEFCLLCGRKWEGIELCLNGCPKFHPAVYDKRGYNQDGYHRDTGLNRRGIRRAFDASYEDELANAENDAEIHDLPPREGWIEDSSEEGIFTPLDFNYEGWAAGNYGRNDGNDSSADDQDGADAGGEDESAVDEGRVDSQADSHGSALEADTLAASIPTDASATNHNASDVGDEDESIKDDDHVSDLADDPLTAPTPADASAEDHTASDVGDQTESDQTATASADAAWVVEAPHSPWVYATRANGTSTSDPKDRRPPSPPVVSQPGYAYIFSYQGRNYNGWGMDEDGYDFDGFDFSGLDRQGRDLFGQTQNQSAQAIANDVRW